MVGLLGRGDGEGHQQDFASSTASGRSPHSRSNSASPASTALSSRAGSPSHDSSPLRTPATVAASLVLAGACSQTTLRLPFAFEQSKPSSMMGKRFRLGVAWRISMGEALLSRGGGGLIPPPPSVRG